MKIALVGNPNCGKTTLFNKMTGKKLAVGNRAGVTVEVSSAKYNDDLLFDLPGVYSLRNSVNEESVAAAFLKGGADYILNVVDVGYLSRSLLLTSQLLALGVPMTLVLTMTDKKSNENLHINEKKLSALLGCPVVIFSKKKRDFERLFIPCDVKKYRRFPPENAKKFTLFDDIEKEVISGKTSKKFSDRLDKILLNKYLAFPIFLIIMTGVLLLSSAFFGNFLGKYINLGISAFSDFLREKMPAGSFFTSLVCDGIITGIGGVLSFLPLILSLFFMLGLLEDCGYLSRIAVLFDGLLSAVGVSGKTAISLVLGCGCTVPAVMSTRTLDISERKKCLSCVHFVPCSAKLPVLSVLMSLCFDKGYLFAPLFYLVGIFAVLIYLFAVKKGSEAFFLMEIPPMQLPDLRSVADATRQKCKGFLLKVSTAVFLSSVAVWLLQSYDSSLSACSAEESMLAKICGVLKYVFLPIGLDDWRITASFLAGFAGKESVVGVLSVLSGGNIASVFNGFTAMQYALFLLLSPPCAAALTAMKKEAGRKSFVKILLWQFFISYTSCALVYSGFLIFSK